MHTFILIAACVAFAPPAAPASEGLAGHWEGKVAAPKGPSTLSLDIDWKADAWVASLGIPEQKVTGIPVIDVQVKQDKVTFRVPLLPGSPSFELTLAAARLTGTLGAGGESIPVELERKGDANVVIAQTDPAVSKELEGDWEGAIALPSGNLRPVVVHFRNQPGGTVKATIDSPSQGAAGLPLEGVAQKGASVEFRVRIAGGSYRGTLNKEAAAIAGEWTQGAGSVPLPLTLRKK